MPDICLQSSVQKPQAWVPTGSKDQGGIQAGSLETHTLAKGVLSFGVSVEHVDRMVEPAEHKHVIDRIVG